MAPRLTKARRLPAAPDRPDAAHKGTFGTVIVVGGCGTMIGAPALCAAAALRSGVGLAKVAAGRAILPFVLTIEPGATGIDVTTGSLKRAMDRADPAGRAVLAVGPGMGKSNRAATLVMAALHGGRRAVLDADGLNLLAASGETVAGLRGEDSAKVVLTPHPGEFARLAKAMNIKPDPAGAPQRASAAAALAKSHGCVVVLKGRRTVITDGRRIAVNSTGNPALATAGSGDVLTGVIASLMAQGLSPFDAAQLGAHLHGLAADLWAAEHGRAGLVARDLASLLPDALRRHRGAKKVPRR
ncbi:MAG: NAD(P)H-hydrate dehydratase [Planctomycetes bacterium]|nr:NAD(P)H-hydrate dehydratase [Planctomycetota bacterium]